MSEESGRQSIEEREEEFGHVVLQTYLGEVYSLDLHETYAMPINIAPGIIGRGFYLPPTGEAAVRLLRRWERIGLRELPLSVPVEIELSFDAEALNELGDMVSRSDLPLGSESPFSGDFFLGGPGRDDFHEMYVEASPPTHRRDRTTWTGTLGGKGSRAGGEFRFVLQQYGTLEPFLLLIALFFAGFMEDTAQATARCRQQALVQCGDAGNIKIVHATRGITGASFGLSGGCQIECFERWNPA